MNGPKHLWSGDWQQESEAASADRASRRAKPVEEPPTVQLPKHSARPRRKGLPRLLPVGLVALVFLVAAAIGLAALLGSSGHKAAPARTHAAAPTPRPTTPSPQPSTPRTTPQPATPTGVTPAPNPATVPAPTRQVSWLGMQIETLPPGAAVIETVKLGSRGDVAGLNPGDVIVAVNNRAINGAETIVGAIHGLKAGAQVPVEVSHGSALEQLNVTLGNPPTVHP
jgi:membrane-associated protease RseP (regulator of RpoE activity)